MATVDRSKTEPKEMSLMLCIKRELRGYAGGQCRINHPAVQRGITPES